MKNRKIKLYVCCNRTCKEIELEKICNMNCYDIITYDYFIDNNNIKHLFLTAQQINDNVHKGLRFITIDDPCGHALNKINKDILHELNSYIIRNTAYIYDFKKEIFNILEM